MIHIFRHFETGANDFLEFTDEENLFEVYKAERNVFMYDWQEIPIKLAIKDEESIIEHQNLLKMEARGDRVVIRITINGKSTWYSPSAVYEKGIPSEQSIALNYFTDPATFFQVTRQHHDVFEILKDERFSPLSKRVFSNILKLVKDSNCDVRVDKYLDYNLKKLKQYGVGLPSLTGTYVDIKSKIAEETISCDYYKDFFHELIDICIDKEVELVGESRVHNKQF